MKFLPVLSAAIFAVSTVSAELYAPAPVKLTDGFAIEPQIEAGVRYDDNIYNSENNSKSSEIYLLKPSIKFGSDDGLNQYGGYYALTSAFYSSGSEDNFVDHTLALLAHTEFTAKQRTDFKLGFNNIHEDRGTGLTEGNAALSSAPLKYNLLSAQGYYQYGAVSAMSRIGAGIQYVDKTYQNFTTQTKYRDAGALKFYADADYDLGGVTFLTFDVFTTNLVYKHQQANTNSRDNRDSRALLGLKWEGLGKTTGIAKVGYQFKTFADAQHESFNGSTADLGIAWEPVQYSTFSAHINRSAEESDTVGDYIEVFGGSLEWAHDWSSQLDSKLQFLYTNENYIGNVREDDTANMMFYLGYNFSRWLKMSAGYEYSNKDSNATNISYDKNTFIIGVSAAL